MCAKHPGPIGSVSRTLPLRPPPAGVLVQRPLLFLLLARADDPELQRAVPGRPRRQPGPTVFVLGVHGVPHVVVLGRDPPPPPFVAVVVLGRPLLAGVSVVMVVVPRCRRRGRGSGGGGGGRGRGGR